MAHALSRPITWQHSQHKLTPYVGRVIKRAGKDTIVGRDRHGPQWVRYRARQWRRRRLGIGHIANVVEPDGSAVAIGAGAPSGGEPSEEPVRWGGA